MERLIGGMLGGDGGGAGFPPTSGGGGDEPASPDEFFAFLQQYTAMGGSLDPDEAPPELGPVLKALAEGSGGVGALREMLAMQPPASAAAAGGRPTVPGAARAPAPQPVGADREEILPEPGFVVKTIDDAGRKIFINVCGHAVQARARSGPAVRCPSTWSTRWPTSRTRRGAAASVPAQRVRGPWASSTSRSAVHRRRRVQRRRRQASHGASQAQGVPRGLCLQWVGQKYSLVLDPKYKLPHRRYVAIRPAPR